MPYLNAQQRNTLEKAVTKARQLAEVGARNALKSLAVDQPEPFQHQTIAQRALRNSLRSKARLLGDERLANGMHTIENLAYELAYEYWHKLLFARFLEANNLLIHPAMGVSVTLDELAELAPDEGYTDKWDAAAAYASNMLPAIFRVEDPLMQISFAPNDRIALETILNELDAELFTADDALGWVYQFWQSEAKEEANKRIKEGEKVDGKKLPAVTQLFTEPYMVHFLIDNTLGAWWVSRNPDVKPPVKFEYLRFAPPPVGGGREGAPAAGTFPGWPNKTADITTLDPCMGSGHFVAALFQVMVKLRMYEENLSKQEATDRVITQNLHGLEIDPRCTQIAAFNLALTAWKFCGHYKELPEMNLACSGVAPKGKKEDWLRLVEKVQDPNDRYRLQNGMASLYDHFQLAPELGSLLDPTTIKADLETASFEELQPVLKKALENERDHEVLERGVMAAGIAKAGQLLANKYTLQITNVPYLSRGKQDKAMSDHIEKHFKEAKGDLATVFLEKMLNANTPGGIASSVIPQNWLFLTSYKKFREKLLKNETWSIVARLGAKGFQTPMWDFNVMLISLADTKPSSNHNLTGLDVSNASNAAAKDEALKTAKLKYVNQKGQLGNPDAVIALEEISSNSLLNTLSYSHHGLTSGDLPRMRVSFWELNKFNPIWIPFQTTTKITQFYGGLESVLRWENGEGAINDLLGARKDGTAAWGKKGIIISQMGAMPASIYIGSSFDNNTAVIIPDNEDDFEAIWTFCSSPEYFKTVRKVDQSLAVTSGTMAKVPIDLEHWQKIAAEKYPNGLPKPYSDDPTQWLFHGHPIKAENALQVAVARLLGYRWPAESDNEMELSDEARELIKQVKELELPFDEDGIVCIPPVYNEHAGAERLRQLLQITWGSKWSNTILNDLLKQAESKKNNLEDWLREEFFAQHCKLFKNRPFIWHIWDGRKDGFSALVNYHKLTADNLKKLIYTYLGDWIRQCESKQKAGESGAEGLLTAALKLKEKLELILVGEKPYDIFVRWKKLEEQPIGWDPDLNDGVRLNIRPFVEAGVLRNKFNVKWGIDRGKNPPGSPWGEIRNNDMHLSLEEKLRARE
jgi:hypothetical protein